jgi:membrane-associated protein
MLDTLLGYLRFLYSTEGITQIITSGGVLVLIAIVFAETGLLVGFFLPGDSLLITAGIIASRTSADGTFLLDIWTLTFALAAAGIIGDQVGYLLGRKTGRAIFHRPDGRFFKQRYVTEAHDFYVRHGGKAIVLARFLPILRTFVPFIAGAVEMPYRRFVAFNIVGGLLWVVSMLWTGYFLGQSRYAKDLHHIIIIVVVVSFLPLMYGAGARAWKSWRSSRPTN